ncbi:MAG: polysaccharide deacetylase family protein [candidate division Zixibacteria bacterium]|nr:polysaccharide deacetylase family protein [candidate division Zixibacteria bacterium]
MTAFIKRLIKHLLAVCIYYSGLLSFFDIIKRLTSTPDDFSILMYHCVLGDTAKEREYLQDGMIVSENIFEKQIAYLSHNYNIIAFDELVNLLKAEKRPPRKTVCITFDDGWRDNYNCAYPILKKHNIPAMIFLPTDFINTGKLFWFIKVIIALSDNYNLSDGLADIFDKVKQEFDDRDAANLPQANDIVDIGDNPDKLIEKLKQYDLEVSDRIIDLMLSKSGQHTDKKRWTLSWDEINEMMRNNIDFGSHGQSHKIMTLLPPDEVRKEMVKSKEIIEKNTNRPIQVFSYPNGDYNADTKILAQKAGYKSAVATSGCEPAGDKPDLFALRRTGIHDGVSTGITGRFSKAMFACYLKRIF